MSKCWYCNSELTSGDNPKHFGICNNCYNEFEGADTVFHSLTNKIVELQKQLEITETQNKRVLEKLELITKSNQELEKQFDEKEEELKKTTAVAEFYKSYYVSFNSKVCDELKKSKSLVG
jgi:chromosome segregation ATPase